MHEQLGCGITTRTDLISLTSINYTNITYRYVGLGLQWCAIQKVGDSAVLQSTFQPLVTTSKLKLCMSHLLSSFSESFSCMLIPYLLQNYIFCWSGSGACYFWNGMEQKQFLNRNLTEYFKIQQNISKFRRKIMCLLPFRFKSNRICIKYVSLTNFSEYLNDILPNYSLL